MGWNAKGSSKGTRPSISAREQGFLDALRMTAAGGGATAAWSDKGAGKGGAKGGGK